MRVARGPEPPTRSRAALCVRARYQHTEPRASSHTNTTHLPGISVCKLILIGGRQVSHRVYGLINRDRVTTKMMEYTLCIS